MKITLVTNDQVLATGTMAPRECCLHYCCHHGSRLMFLSIVLIHLIYPLPVMSIEIIPITLRGGANNLDSNIMDVKLPRNNKQKQFWLKKGNQPPPPQQPQPALDELIAAAAQAVSETTAAAATGTAASPTSTNSIKQTIRQLVEERTKQARGGAFAVAGSFSSIWNRLTSSKDWNWAMIRTAIAKAFDVADTVSLVVIGWCTEPIARHYYRIKYHKQMNSPEEIQSSYEDSWLYKTVNVIQELGRLGAVMYVIDILSVVIGKMGFTISSVVNERIGQTILTVWCATRIRRLKQIMFFKMMKQHPEGRAAILSKVTDGILGVIVLFFIHDIFQVTIGKGLQSIAAVTGLSTVIFSLAAKDFAQMLLAGVAIYNSDKFYEGEKVVFGDGTSGTIEHQGYFDLHIRGSDGMVTQIPNGQIINQRVQNLSRTHTSTVRQTLSFRYEDIKKIPTLLQDIQKEIALLCPKLIADGSRTFRAVWTDYRQDHLEVVVEASFHIAPTSDEFYYNKQNMLQAIANAVERNHAEFALPTSLCLSEEIKK